MADFVLMAAKKIPGTIRRYVLEEGLIDKARNVYDLGTPMEYLFDVYEEFVDLSGEHDDFTCGRCREHVLHQWYLFRPYLIQLENAI